MTAPSESELELRSISREAIAEAVAKAEHYRLLNQPEQAESICLDVLQVDPDNQRVRVLLILSLSDQFGTGGDITRRAHDELRHLAGDYERSYYKGLVHEREARAMLERGMFGSFAYEGLREAMQCYDEAAKWRQAGNDDPILRWNSCLRTIRTHSLRPRDDEEEQPLE